LPTSHLPTVRGRTLTPHPHQGPRCSPACCTYPARPGAEGRRSWGARRGI